MLCVGISEKDGDSVEGDTNPLRLYDRLSLPNVDLIIESTILRSFLLTE